MKLVQLKEMRIIGACNHLASLAVNPRRVVYVRWADSMTVDGAYTETATVCMDDGTVFRVKGSVRDLTDRINAAPEGGSHADA